MFNLKPHSKPIRRVLNLILISAVTVVPLFVSSTVQAKEPENLKWKENLSGSEMIRRTSPAVGPGGNIYVVSQNGKLYSFEKGGKLNWRFELDSNINSSPVVGEDSTVYICGRGKIFAINRHGILRWKHIISNSWARSSPAVGEDGAIYSAGHGLYKFSKDGQQMWHYKKNYEFGSPVIGKGGTIYVGSGSGKLYAITQEGKLKWKFETGSDLEGHRPAVGPNGIIYICPGNEGVYAIRPDGTLKWKFTTGNDSYSSPAIGEDTIYLLSGKNLYAIGLDKQFKWRYRFGHSLGDSSPTLSQDKTIYLNGGQSEALYAIQEGSLKWEFQFKGTRAADCSAVITKNGTIYAVAGWDDAKLYAINGKSSIPTNSAWPMLGGNIRHTGNANDGLAGGKLKQTSKDSYDNKTKIYRTRREEQLDTYLTLFQKASETEPRKKTIYVEIDGINLDKIIKQGSITLAVDETVNIDYQDIEVLTPAEKIEPSGLPFYKDYQYKPIKKPSPPDAWGTFKSNSIELLLGTIPGIGQAMGIWDYTSSTLAPYSHDVKLGDYDQIYPQVTNSYANEFDTVTAGWVAPEECWGLNQGAYKSIVVKIPITLPDTEKHTMYIHGSYRVHKPGLKPMQVAYEEKVELSG